MSQPMPWNLCVVSHYPDLPNCAELANALLYGEKVVWLPTELAELAQGYFSVASETRSVNVTIEWCTPVKVRSPEQLNHRRKGYNELFNQIEAAGLSVEVPVTCLPHKFIEEAVEIVSGRLPEREVKAGSSEALICDLLRTFKTFNLRTMLESFKLIGELDARRILEIRQYLDDNRIHGCIFEPGSKFLLEPVGDWSAHPAAQLLMNEMSRLLLPDVSRLPIPAIAELKEDVKDYLDPARADMLRLSKQLREMVKEKQSLNDVAHEASNIIATEVEPVVRESARQTAEVMKSRWKKFLRGTLNFIGVCGLGFLNPAMFAKEAAMGGLKLVSDSTEAIGKTVPPTHTARLVLEIKQKLETQQKRRSK